MATRTPRYPVKGLIKCAACGHVSTGDANDFPPDGTPPEKIRSKHGNSNDSNPI